jgi:prepilin-type processing-associated H-X9-DG protein
MATLQASHRFRGVTLVELVLVILIVAVLVAVITPAVMRVRDRAAQAQCMDNLKAIALACHEFHDKHKALPPPFANPGGGKSRGSLFYYLLPLIGHSDLFNAAGNDSWNQNATVIPMYLCPADPTGNVDGTWNGHASVNYAGNLGVFMPSHLQINGAPDNDIVHARAAGNLLTAMPDGTSNTILFAERYRVCAPFWGGQTNPLWAAHPWNTPDGPWSIGMFGWAEAPFTASAWPWGTTAAPNYTLTNLPFQVGPTPASCNWFATQGRHSGGMSVALGDGSVRTVTALVSAEAWRSACVPNDGNPLPYDID